MAIRPGKFIATVQSYGIAEKKETQKAPQVAITFGYDDNGTQQTITYYGSLSNDAAPYTIKNLITCGMKTDSIDSLCEPGAFTEKEVQIVIEADEYQGKTTMKVRYINEIGGAQFKALAKDAAKAQLGHFNSFIAATRKEMGVTQKAAGDDFDL